MIFAIINEANISNRELAALFWLSVLGGASIMKSDLRRALLVLLKVLFARQLLFAFSAAALWISICIFLIYSVSGWSWGDTKAAVFWAAGFAFVVMIDAGKAAQDSLFFTKLFRDILSVTAFIEFMLGLHSFSFIFELILWPILACVSWLFAMAGAKPEHAAAKSLTGWMLGGVAVIYLGYGIFDAVTNSDKFLSFRTLREFSLPVVLSLLFIPFLYGLKVFLIYENAYVRLAFIIKNERVLRYAKKYALRFRLDFDLLKRWLRYLTINSPTSEADLENAKSKVTAHRWKEKNPFPLGLEQGWQPKAAKGFLLSGGITTEDYHPSYGEWVSSSSPIKLSDEVLASTVTYYLKGDEFAVKEISLELDVWFIESAAPSDARFFHLVSLLLEKALNSQFAQEFSRLSANDDRLEIKCGNKRVTLSRRSWANGKGYCRELIIAI